MEEDVNKSSPWADLQPQLHNKTLWELSQSPGSCLVKPVMVTSAWTRGKEIVYTCVKMTEEAKTVAKY